MKYAPLIIVLAIVAVACTAACTTTSQNAESAPAAPTTSPLQTPDATMQPTSSAVPTGTHTPDDAPQLGMTIHSALKTSKIKDSTPLPGNIFVVVNMTIENPGMNEAFAANESTVDITGGGAITQKLYDKVANPFHWGFIPPGTSMTGEVVFGVRESTDHFTVTLLGDDGAVLLAKDIGAVPVGSYVPSLDDPALLASTNFSFVVESLDTPEKAAEYADAKFDFVYHDGCISYPPEEFFRLEQGDCKDYATFLSSVLAYHGYDAQIVAFKYFKENKRNGHVVTLVRDRDGSLYYMTTPAVSVLRRVASVEDLLAKECARLGIPAIANSTVVPPGSLDACVL